MTADEKINSVIDILKQVVAEQATCEISGHDWGSKLLNKLEELKTQPLEKE